MSLFGDLQTIPVEVLLQSNVGRGEIPILRAELAQLISEVFKELKRTLLVTISGQAGVGKTPFSGLLAEELERQGTPSAIITGDNYLLSTVLVAGANRDIDRDEIMAGLIMGELDRLRLERNQVVIFEFLYADRLAGMYSDILCKVGVPVMDLTLRRSEGPGQEKDLSGESFHEKE